MGLKMCLYCLLCFSQIFAKLPTLCPFWRELAVDVYFRLPSHTHTQGSAKRGAALLHYVLAHFGCRFSIFPRHLQNASIPVLQERAMPMPSLSSASWALFNGRTKTIPWASKTKKRRNGVTFPPIADQYVFKLPRVWPNVPRVSAVNVSLVACLIWARKAMDKPEVSQENMECVLCSSYNDMVEESITFIKNDVDEKTIFPVLLNNNNTSHSDNNNNNAKKKKNNNNILCRIKKKKVFINTENIYTKPTTTTKK